MFLCFPSTQKSQRRNSTVSHSDQAKKPCRTFCQPPTARGKLVHNCSRVVAITNARAYRCDLTLSFEIRVGSEPSQQSFSVHHELIVQRSAHLRALRVEQTTNFPDLPVILLDGDPEVFSAYLHCVYLGAESIQERIALMAEENGYSKMDDSSNDDGGDEGGDENRDMSVEPVEKFPDRPLPACRQVTRPNLSEHGD
jgi:hypothetical protein